MSRCEAHTAKSNQSPRTMSEVDRGTANTTERTRQTRTSSETVGASRGASRSRDQDITRRRVTPRLQLDTAKRDIAVSHSEYLSENSPELADSSKQWSGEEANHDSELFRISSDVPISCNPSVSDLRELEEQHDTSRDISDNVTSMDTPRVASRSKQSEANTRRRQMDIARRRARTHRNLRSRSPQPHPGSQQLHGIHAMAPSHEFRPDVQCRLTFPGPLPVVGMWPFIPVPVSPVVCVPHPPGYSRLQNRVDRQPWHAAPSWSLGDQERFRGQPTPCSTEQFRMTEITRPPEAPPREMYTNPWRYQPSQPPVLQPSMLQHFGQQMEGLHSSNQNNDRVYRIETTVNLTSPHRRQIDEQHNTQDTSAIATIRGFLDEFEPIHQTVDVHSQDPNVTEQTLAFQEFVPGQREHFVRQYPNSQEHYENSQQYYYQ